jgi:hypothetical protein
MAEGKIIPEFGAIVRRLRGDLSYERAAEKLRYAVSTNAIRLMETGKVGRERTIRALAEGFVEEICEQFGEEIRARYGHCDPSAAADWLAEKAGLGSGQRLGYGDLRDVYVTNVLRTARDAGAGTALLERAVLETPRPTREELTAATARAAARLKAYLSGNASLDGWVLYGGLDLSSLPSLLDEARAISGLASPVPNPPAEPPSDRAAAGTRISAEALARLSEQIAENVADRLEAIIREHLPARVQQPTSPEDDHLRRLHEAEPAPGSGAPSGPELLIQALADLAERHPDALLPVHLFRGASRITPARARELLSQVNRLIPTQASPSKTSD